MCAATSCLQSLQGRAPAFVGSVCSLLSPKRVVMMQRQRRRRWHQLQTHCPPDRPASTSRNSSGFCDSASQACDCRRSFNWRLAKQSQIARFTLQKLLIVVVNRYNSIRVRLSSRWYAMIAVLEVISPITGLARKFFDYFVFRVCSPGLETETFRRCSRNQC